MYEGMLDFQRQYRGERFTLYAPFDSQGAYQYIPQHLQIADKTDGSPDIRLTLIRGQNPLLPPSPYGVLDFRVRFAEPVNEALALARTLRNNAMISAARPAGGSLRLRLVDEADESKPAADESIDMVWNSLGIARFYFRTDAVGATLIKRSIEEGIVALHAMAAIEIEGIAPRVDVKIKFDPRELYDSIKAFINHNHDVSWDQLVDYFSQHVTSLPILIMGDTQILTRLFAEALADHYSHRFTRLTAPPVTGGSPRLLLLESDRIRSGVIQWDMAQALRVKRAFAMYLDPIAAARQVTQSGDSSKVIVNKIVPPMQTGYQPIHISANLPSDRQGILQLGVVVTAEPHPPARMYKIIETVVLQPPSDEQTIVLRFAPNESLHYKFSTFVIMRGPDQRVKKIEGQLGEYYHDSEIALDVSDFPIFFVPIEASQGLLKLAQVQVVYERWENNHRLLEEFELQPDRSNIAVILPKSSEKARLTVTARSHNSGAILSLGPLPATSQQIGLHSFPEYGPHEINVDIDFGEEVTLLALELLPQGRPETSEFITVLHFTTERSQRTWQWFAQSPFEPGYRFRFLASPREPEHEWSEVRSPFADLHIHAESQQVVEGVVP